MPMNVRILIGGWLGAELLCAASVWASDLSGSDLEFWKLNWRPIAQSFAKVDQDFHACPDWDARFPSSYRNGQGERQGVDQWTRENTESQRITIGGFSKIAKQIPLKEEAEAAVLSLPDLALGHYGQIHSALVVEVLGPREMIVRDVWALDTQIARQKEEDLRKADQYIKQKQDEYRQALEKARRGGKPPQPPEGLDKIKPEIEWRYTERSRVIQRQQDWTDRTVKLLGFSTAGALPGRRWSPAGREPARIAVVGEQTAAGRRGSNVVLTAVNAEAFRSFLTEDEFKGLLEARGIPQAQFVAEARKFMRDSASDSSGATPRRQIVEMLEKLRPQPVMTARGIPSGSRVTLEPAGPDETDDWFIRRSGRPARTPASQPAVPTDPQAVSPQS